MILENSYHSPNHAQISLQAQITLLDLIIMITRNVQYSVKFIVYKMQILIIIPLTLHFYKITSVFPPHHLCRLLPKCAYKVQSLHTGLHILSSSLFFIDHKLCVQSDVRHFQALFCAYATFINEAHALHRSGTWLGHLFTFQRSAHALNTPSASFTGEH